MHASALKRSESRSVVSDALRPCGLHRPCWSVLNGQLTSSFCPAQGAQLSHGSWAGRQFAGGRTHGNAVHLKPSAHGSSSVPNTKGSV